MRGYAPTELPADGPISWARWSPTRSRCTPRSAATSDAVLIGHDWGAEAAYGAAAIAPERWRRLVTISVPPLALRLSASSPTTTSSSASFYVFFLKTRLRRGGESPPTTWRFIDRLWQDWSPGYDAAADMRMAKQCLREPRHLRPRSATTEPTSPDSIPPARATRSPPEHEALLRTPPQPTLYLHGDRDGSLDVGLVRDAELHLAPGSRLEVIENAGHFLHLERPSAVNERILSWVAA